MMNPAIIHFTGLSTDPTGDCCGIRPWGEAMAKVIGGDFYAIAYDDARRASKYADIMRQHTHAYAGGHSHGAWEMYEMLANDMPPEWQSPVAYFLDICPEWEPARWIGPDLFAPKGAAYSIDFFQRNDGLLSGVRMAANEVYDCTPWGLEHVSMCTDGRVQRRISVAILNDMIKRTGS